MFLEGLSYENPKLHKQTHNNTQQIHKHVNIYRMQYLKHTKKNITGNILSKHTGTLNQATCFPKIRILTSCQAAYFLKIEDPEIIPSNVRSTDRGF